MIESDLIPDRLVSFEKIDDTSYVLDVVPQQHDDDFYYEIHISTDSSAITLMKSSIGKKIFVEIISSTDMDIWEGEWIEESYSIATFKYSSYERKKTEKANKEIWKSKVMQLEVNYRNKFNTRLKEFRRNRLDIIYLAKKVYKTEIENYSNEKFLKCGASLILNLIFPSLYSSAAWYTFNTFIDPNFEVYKKTDKDWKETYINLEQNYSTMLIADLSDRYKIKSHIIQLYKKEFENRLWSDLANHPYIEKEKYTQFFYELMTKLENDPRLF
ncbi:MAG: hypothetical protein GQ574_07745 [Crocinitomix sp.]|nr:hypothetical protein [Crocinitomix sp.]